MAAVKNLDLPSVRGGIDFISTPPDVAAKMVDLLELRGGETILEPSAGTGVLIETILELRDDVWVTAVDLSDDAIRVLGDEHSFVGSKVIIWQDDFMEFEPLAKYTRIIMNPPWSKCQDVKHVLRAWDVCLTDDGILVALVAKSIMYRRDKATRRLRSLVHDHGEFCGTVVFREPQVSGQLIRLVK